MVTVLHRKAPIPYIQHKLSAGSSAGAGESIKLIENAISAFVIVFCTLLKTKCEVWRGFGILKRKNMIFVECQSSETDFVVYFEWLGERID
jgi:hypothetical protein